MSDIPLVSVIVPVYNGEEYVNRCIENLKSQSYDNLEIIVVDDGSTDLTRSISESHSIRVLHQSNQGVSSARNVGIAAAKGVFIHFMDVDDQINVDYYKNMVNALMRTGADLGCSGMVNEKFKHKTILFKKRETLTTTHDKLTQTYVGKWGYVWRFVFRTDFLRSHRLFFEEGKIVEDIMVSLPAVFFAKKMVVVPDAVYTYNFREDSQISTKDTEKAEMRHRDWLHAKEQMLSFADKHGFKIPGVNSGHLRYFIWKFFKV